MLTRFRVNNFRNLLNVEFAPAGVNLLLGPNNAGKTNLAAAMRFLSLSSQMPLDEAMQQAVGERWNLTNVYAPECREVKFEIACTLEHKDEQLLFDYTLVTTVPRSTEGATEGIAIKSECLKILGGVFSEQTILLEYTNGEIHALCEPKTVYDCSNKREIAFLNDNSASCLNLRFDPNDHFRMHLFRNYLRSWSYFNLSPDALRKPDVLKDSSVVVSDGGNLTRALHALHNEKPRLERKLIEGLKLLEPKLDLLSFNSPDPDHVYMYLEDKQGHRFGVKSISDGTLRYLAMLYIVLAAEQAAASGASPLILIEEPENGLYVGALKPLIQQIDPSGKAGQFIFTTHSPYLIDLFDANLSGIHCMKPGVPSPSLVKPDANKLERLLKEMPLGELFYREMLA